MRHSPIWTHSSTGPHHAAFVSSKRIVVSASRIASKCYRVSRPAMPPMRPQDLPSDCSNHRAPAHAATALLFSGNCCPKGQPQTDTSLVFLQFLDRRCCVVGPLGAAVDLHPCAHRRPGVWPYSSTPHTLYPMC